MTRLALAMALSLALGSVSSAALAQETAASAEGLSVTEMTLARGYADGAAVDPTTTFSRSDGRVWVVIRLANESGAESEIRVTFERADAEAGSGGGGVTLSVPARRSTRTVARTGTARPAGRYRVVVRTPDGTIISQQEFSITE